MSDADRTTALADALIDAADLPGSVREARLVEIGIGGRPDVARALAARGATVLATDVSDRSVPDAGNDDSGEMEFVRDDVTDPDLSVYRDADLLYALRFPPELHGAFASLAGDLAVPAAFTTLGGDPPAVPAEPRQLPGTTLYVDVRPTDAAGRPP